MSKLYIVATPIGNLEDITLRARRTLEEADVIACEDTRVTVKLLNHYGIKKHLVSYHAHSTEAKVESVLRDLARGKNIALATDAGTPGISDPGNELIAEIVKRAPETEVIPIPGPSAVIAALSVSGFSTSQFLFLGFLPHKKGRQTLFRRIAEAEETVVFYESVHRIEKALQSLAEVLSPDRSMVVCRELTKQFETVYRGNATEVLVELQADTVKGEFVVVVEGK